MPAAKRAAATKTAKSKSRPGAGLAGLPEWDLGDLYAGIDDPRVVSDLDQADAESRAFEETYKGKLSALAESLQGPALAQAVKRYEALDDLIGRIISYAGLIHAGHTVDPARAKFYGDVQDRITAASTHLLFFVLELNRLDDHKLAAAMADTTLAHYRPWLEDIRKEKPYQLEDRIEQLFHEKSATAYSAWNRLFDETIASLRFKVGPKVLAIEPTLNLMQDTNPANRKAAANALATTFKANARLFTLVTNTLAKDKEISDRWRGFTDVADSRHLSNRVEPEVVEALVAAVRAAYPRLSHRYYALEGALVRQETAAALGPQRAAAEGRGPHHPLERGAGHRALRLWGVLAQDGYDRGALLRQQLDRRAGAARQGTRRLCASDRAVGASLCAAQLPGQAARRDDPRP